MHLRCYLSVFSLRYLPPRFLLCGLLAAFVVAAAATKSPASEEPNVATSEVSDEQAEFFRSKVLPLLESRCFECHGDQDDIEAELSLASRAAMLKGGETGPAMIPSDPDRSLLIQAIRYESLQMPPRSKMPDEEIEILLKWIADGAAWPSEMESAEVPKERTRFPLEERVTSHWAWKKIQRPAVPEVKQRDWPADDIDRFLLAKMEHAEISPALDADRRAILRRLYFDLIGLPPTIEQQEQFFNDPAETSAAMKKVVDELLASPQFGERWARHWLDLMRYAETLGHEFDYPLPYAWRYRDYVIRALNANVPYDQFVREHLAGDLLTKPRTNPELGFNESIIATGFWYLCEDKHAPVDVKAEEALRIDNQIDVFGKAFLGLTIACARCHDHKFDAITADDYYALSGFLQSSRRRIDWIDAHQETERLVEDLLSKRAAASQIVQDGLAQLAGNVRETLLLGAIGELDIGDHGPTSDQRVPRLKEELLAPKTRELSHPLSLLASLLQKPAEQTDADVVSTWISKRELAIRISDEQILDSFSTGSTSDLKGRSFTYADFRTGLPADWLWYGAAFHDLSSRAAELVGEPSLELSGNQTDSVNEGQTDVSSLRAQHFIDRGMKCCATGCVVDTGGSVTSASLSPRLRGSLQSPEFELTHPEVHVLAAGRNARVRLVIDGYVMNEFSELLFSGCRQPIDTDGEFRWIRIAGDVKRYVGHRCHLEFLDEGDGWFAVREVKFVAQPDEMPVTRPEMAITNQNLIIHPEHPRSTLIREWANQVGRDPIWRDMVVRLRLLPEEQQAALSSACAAWMKTAEQPQPGDPVLVMCEGSGEDEYVFIRGNHNNRGPTATRHLLTALDGGRPLQDGHRSGRLELAERVLADSNPFPSRVMVNRVWQHLFGRGIVATSDNFGVLGEAPTHPELLDYLAEEFREDGWSLKRLIRRIVLTRAYRLSSQRSDVVEQKDPSNKLLHRFSIRRLEAEAIRDAILAVSGRLDQSMYGPSVPVFLTEFMQGRGRPGQSGPLDGAGRRSIYQSVNRNFLNPFMLAFDTPQPATAIGRRTVSNVPAQALMLLNNEFIHQQAKVWAERLLKDSSLSGPETLQIAFRQALCRIPSPEEQTAIADFATGLATEQNLHPESALRDLTILTEVCHILLNQKEFVYLD
jgi:hypothetical protein